MYIIPDYSLCISYYMGTSDVVNLSANLANT